MFQLIKISCHHHNDLKKIVFPFKKLKMWKTQYNLYMDYSRKIHSILKIKSTNNYINSNNLFLNNKNCKTIELSLWKLI